MRPLFTTSGGGFLSRYLLASVHIYSEMFVFCCTIFASYIVPVLQFALPTCDVDHSNCVGPSVIIQFSARFEQLKLLGKIWFQLVYIRTPVES